VNVLDLFSGIGGFSLGLERAGMRTVAFCERDEFCQSVLRKHWPGVPVFDDVCTLTADTLSDAIGINGGSGWTGGSDTGGARQSQPERSLQIDVICGGFPCQDISLAGKGAGIDGDRSGLWREFARLIGEIRPRYVIVENVAALLGRGIERVLGDLAALGYDAEWHCIPASAVGAPHRRDRVWIIAYPHRDGEHAGAVDAEVAGASQLGGDADIQGLAFREGIAGHIGEELKAAFGADWWLPEPDVGRVAHGVPARVDRLRALGNAVVPQIPEIIGRAIMRAA
jgi:DNA (cytosine-5)-methyltransferase 1